MNEFLTEMGRFNHALLHMGVMALLDEEIMNPIVKVNCLTFVSLSQLVCD